MAFAQRRLISPVLLCLWLAPIASAQAQVNAETLRPRPLQAGLSGGLDANLSLFRGNIELLDLGGAARLQYQTLHPATSTSALPFFAQRLFLTGNGRFADRAGTPFISQGFVHARWTAMWSPRLGSDLFAQYQSNKFLRLQGRAVVGGGLRVELWHEAALLIWAGSGYLLEYSRITVLPVAPDPPETLEHRSTNYLTARIALLEGMLLIQNTTYLQPRWDRWSDYRILEELELLVKLTTLLSFGTTLGILYDSAPPMGVVPADLRLLQGVHLAF